MSAQVKAVARAKPRGIILKKGKLLIIIIDEVTYFVSIKALENILNDVKQKTPLLGY